MARDLATSMALPMPMPIHTRNSGDRWPKRSSFQCSLLFKKAFMSMLRVVRMKKWSKPTTNTAASIR